MKKFLTQLSKTPKRLTLTESLLIIFCISSITLRIYLVFSVPAWQDEIFTLRAMAQPLKEIFLGMTDRVHPPGYYVLLKILSFLNNYLFTFRLVSVLGFAINLLLLYEIGDKYSKNLSTNLVLAYGLSTYFVVFDWQARMYTLCTTFILISLHTLLTNSRRLSNLPPWFFIINALGLFLDYAFFWYFIPLTLFSLINIIPMKNPRNKNSLMIQNIKSWIILFLIFPNFLKNIPYGVRGISWSSHYLEPKYFFSIFTGGIIVQMLSIFSLVFIYFGVYYGLKNKRLHKPTSLLISISLFSGIGTMMISKVLNTPVFHIRSLQIIGITIIWLYSITLTNFKSLGSNLYRFSIFTLFISFITQMIISPGTYF